MIRLIKLIIWISLIVGVIFLWQYSSFENTPLTGEETQIEITGGGFQSVLIDAGVNPLFTKLYLKGNTPDFELQKGKYIIPANADVLQYIEALKTPINENDIFFRSLEGSNIFDIDQCLSNPASTIYYNEVSDTYEGCIFDVDGPLKQPLIKSGDFVQFSESVADFSSLKADYPFIADASSLEGFLYPDTYAINPNNFTIKNLTQKMLNNFKRKVIDTGIINDMGSIEILDIINLASIVEKEERNPSEKSTVAGILKKRLEEGWMIGADITVCYPFRLTSEQCKLSVTKYLYEKNEYNTRQMIGLPAGPISNPTAQTIESTINHEVTNYYYYLHDTQTGQIYYGVTNADHERNKQLYLR